MDWQVHQGDSLEVLKTLEADSVDSIVTDPPYGWRFMGKAWDSFDIERTLDRDKTLATDDKTTLGMTAVKYDNGAKANRQFQAWTEAWAREAMRVLKPGGHMLVFCGPRTYHRMVSGVEDAGFEIRDMIQWLFGSGFPKSHDVSKAIDKAAGAERERLSTKSIPGGIHRGMINDDGWDGTDQFITAPATDAAKQWQGWGSALKPAHESIVVARKPLSERTLAKNVLKHGTGALNIDASRIVSSEKLARPFNEANNSVLGKFANFGNPNEPAGRWPANVILSCSCETERDQPVMIHNEGCAVAMLDEQSGVPSAAKQKIGAAPRVNLGYKLSASSADRSEKIVNYSSDGSAGASRFFYVAKTSKAERNAGCEGMAIIKMGVGDERPSGQSMQRLDGRAERANHNHHPTVKPARLMAYLIKLVTPPEGVVLDPFTGSGSTGVAAVTHGFSFVGIEREAEYVDIARARIQHACK